MYYLCKLCTEYIRIFAGNTLLSLFFAARAARPDAACRTQALAKIHRRVKFFRLFKLTFNSKNNILKIQL